MSILSAVINKNQTKVSTLLKRPDGSLITEPQEATKLSIINHNNKCRSHEWIGRIYCNQLKKGLVFLEEDGLLAESKARMLSTQDMIKYEIDKLNAEQGWVPIYSNDYKTNNEKYVFHNPNNHITFKIVKTKSSDKEMSHKTAQIIVEKFSQDELKQYLEIII